MAQPRLDLILLFSTQVINHPTEQATAKTGFAKTGVLVTITLVKQRFSVASTPQPQAIPPSTTVKAQLPQPFPVATGRVRSLPLLTRTTGPSTQLTVPGIGATVVTLASSRCA